MKTALLLIPGTNDRISRFAYLQLCIEKTLAEEFMPFAPGMYEHYSVINISEFIDKVLPFTDAVFLFIDFGIDKTMFDVVDRSVSAKIELRYRRAIPLDTTRIYRTLSQILSEVSRKVDISLELLQSKSRKQDIVDARFVYFRRAREINKASLEKIGLLVGKDHASVLHGIREAYTQKAVIDLYNKCYAKAKIKITTLGPDKNTEDFKTPREPIERPVLPYRSMDKREQIISSKQSALQGVRTRGFSNPIAGYRPHNSKGNLRGSMG